MALGAHYVPFVFLYGMRLFGALAAVLWLAGAALALWVDLPFAAGGWITAALLAAFGLAGRRAALREESVAGGAATPSGAGVAPG